MWVLPARLEEPLLDPAQEPAQLPELPPPLDVSGLQLHPEVANELQAHRNGTPLDHQPPMDEAGRLVLAKF